MSATCVQIPFFLCRIAPIRVLRFVGTKVLSRLEVQLLGSIFVTHDVALVISQNMGHQSGGWFPFGLFLKPAQRDF